MIFSFLNHLSLSNKIRLMLISMALPLVIMICVLLFMFVRYIEQYDRIVENLSVASEFSIDFKKDLDYKMYVYIINRQNFNELDPLGDVDHARGVTQRLKGTTTRSDSIQRLNDIDRFLDNLESGINELREERSYDRSMQRLESNIRVLTELLRERYQEYIYHEVKNLYDVRSTIFREMYQVMIATGICALIMVLLMFILAFRTTNSISKPLKKLRENVRMVTRGDFNVQAVDSEDDDVSALSIAFEKMVDQIGVLMENVRAEQQNLHRTELRLLQEQIKPHFLYNTFDTIVWLAEDGQNEEVIHVTSSLSNFFRSSLSGGDDIIAIHVESLHIRSYLEIQQVRYRDILSFEIHIPKELEQYTIPKLTLQPLVENALYHGIKNKRGPGKIVVHGCIDGDMLTLSVRDDGIGMTPEVLASVRDSINGGSNKANFGMANVWERMRLYYGENCGIEIDSQECVFTEVKVHFPAKKAC